MHTPLPPPPSADAVPTSVGPPAQPRSKWRRKRVAAGAIGLLLIGNNLVDGDSAEVAEPATTTEAVVEAEPVEAEESTTTTELIETEVLATVETRPSTTSSSSTSTTTSTTITTSGAEVAGPALAILDQTQPVDRHSAPVPYERDDYTGGGWDDTDRDCQSDRHEVLIAESLESVTFNNTGCRVETGRWIDAFTGNTLTHANQTSIDHFIPLSAAHRAGAWAWDNDTKRRFAHDIDYDPAHTVVSPSVNDSKGDKEPDRWKPPLEAGWCQYAIDWVGVKHRWQLAFTHDEIDALRHMLDTCDDPDAVLREPAWSPSPALPVPALPAPALSDTDSAPSTGTPSTSNPPATGAPETRATGVVVETCLRRAEEVVIANLSDETVTLTGWHLHDQGNNHRLALDTITLAPTQRITIITGENAQASAGTIVWKNENVWNNDGDTAYLRHNGTETSSVRCR